MNPDSIPTGRAFLFMAVFLLLIMAVPHVVNSSSLQEDTISYRNQKHSSNMTASYMISSHWERVQSAEDSYHSAAIYTKKGSVENLMIDIHVLDQKDDPDNLEHHEYRLRAQKYTQEMFGIDIEPVGMESIAPHSSSFVFRIKPNGKTLQTEKATACFYLLTLNQKGHRQKITQDDEDPASSSFLPLEHICLSCTCSDEHQEAKEVAKKVVDSFSRTQCLFQD